MPSIALQLVLGTLNEKSFGYRLTFDEDEVELIGFISSCGMAQSRRARNAGFLEQAKMMIGDEACVCSFKVQATPMCEADKQSCPTGDLGIDRETLSLSVNAGVPNSPLGS